MTRVRNWLLTDYEHSIEFWGLFLEDGNHKINYFIGQQEICPTTSRLHVQAYAEFDNAYTLGGVKKMLDNKTIHCEPRKGTQEQAVEYCSKLNTRAPNTLPFEWGEKKEQGKRNDLNRAVEELSKGLSVKHVIDNQAGLLPYINALCKYKSMLHEDIIRTEAPIVTVYIGPPGVGKTRKVYDSEPILYRVSEPTSTMWFDGYTGQEAVLFDDFCGNIRFHFLLQLLDRYPLRVNIKGGTTNWCPLRIYITSNTHPTLWYPNCPNVLALNRRLNHIEYLDVCTDVQKCPVILTDPSSVHEIEEDL